MPGGRIAPGCRDGCCFSRQAVAVRTAGIEGSSYLCRYVHGRRQQGHLCIPLSTSTGKTVPDRACCRIRRARLSLPCIRITARCMPSTRLSVREGGNGAVSAFSIDAGTGRLTFLNKVSSGPGSLSSHGRQIREWLLAANYSSGSVSVFPIRDDGRLGEASALRCSTADQAKILGARQGPMPIRSTCRRTAGFCWFRIWGWTKSWCIASILPGDLLR